MTIWPRWCASCWHQVDEHVDHPPRHPLDAGAAGGERRLEQQPPGCRWTAASGPCSAGLLGDQPAIERQRSRTCPAQARERRAARPGCGRRSRRWSGRAAVRAAAPARERGGSTGDEIRGDGTAATELVEAVQPGRPTAAESPSRILLRGSPSTQVSMSARGTSATACGVITSAGDGPARSQRSPSRSRNTATAPYGSSRGDVIELRRAARAVRAYAARRSRPRRQSRSRPGQRQAADDRRLRLSRRRAPAQAGQPPPWAASARPSCCRPRDRRRRVRRTGRDAAPPQPFAELQYSTDAARPRAPDMRSRPQANEQARHGRSHGHQAAVFSAAP